MKAKCGHCATEHDLSTLEPSHALPDAAFGLSDLDKRHRLIASKNVCQIKAPSDMAEHQCFVRVLLPIPVAGREPLRWGVWVQVAKADFFSVLDVWDSKSCVGHEWPGLLANALPGYPESLQLTGRIAFKNLTDIPYLTLDEADSQLVRDQRIGVGSTRALEWLLAIHHPEVTS